MRTKKFIFNFLSSYFFYFILAALGFLKVRFFISGLGENLFALNQLYSNIFTYLTLSEAGVGIALISKLYKPLARNNNNEVNELYSEASYIFKRVAVLILALSLLFSFFVGFLILDNNFDLLFLNVTFILFSLKSVIDYFFFAPRFVVEANQKNYKINFRLYSFRIVEIIVEIILLSIGINYIFILVPSIFIRIIQNVVVNKKIYKIYPWLSKVRVVNKKIKKEMGHLFIHRVVSLIENNIDIVILSTFAGYAFVATYSIYNYFTKYINDTIAQIFNAIKNPIGEIINKTNLDKLKIELKNIQVIFSFLAIFVVVTMYYILSPFVNIWVGSAYSISNITLVLFLLIFYYKITIRESMIISDAIGLFKDTKWVVAVSAVINLILSLVLVSKFKINGVLFSTVISNYLCNLVLLPIITYRNLKIKINFWYYRYHLINFLTILLVIFVINLFNLNKIFVTTSFIQWTFGSMIVAVITFVIVSSIFYFIHKSFRGIIVKIYKTIKNIFLKR